VDLIDLNETVYIDGMVRLRQYIFWELDFHFGIVVVDYVMDFPANVYSGPSYSNGKWTMIVSEHGGNGMVRVVADRFIETVSTFDPEQANRQILPLDLRTRLGGDSVQR